MQTTSQLLVRDPDGVPHQIVGLTWLVAFLMAASCFLALASGPVTGGIALVLVPGAIFALDRRARLERRPPPAPRAR